MRQMCIMSITSMVLMEMPASQRYSIQLLSNLFLIKPTQFHYSCMRCLIFHVYGRKAYYLYGTNISVQHHIFDILSLEGFLSTLCYQYQTHQYNEIGICVVYWPFQLIVHLYCRHTHTDSHNYIQISIVYLPLSFATTVPLLLPLSQPWSSQ